MLFVKHVTRSQTLAASALPEELPNLGCDPLVELIETPKST